MEGKGKGPAGWEGAAGRVGGTEGHLLPHAEPVCGSNRAASSSDLHKAKDSAHAPVYVHNCSMQLWEQGLAGSPPDHM
jgi:hypothetical protein